MFTYKNNEEEKTSNKNIEWYKIHSMSISVLHVVYCFVDHEIFNSEYHIDELLCLYGDHFINKNKKNQDG